MNIFGGYFLVFIVSSIKYIFDYSFWSLTVIAIEMKIEEYFQSFEIVIKFDIEV